MDGVGLGGVGWLVGQRRAKGQSLGALGRCAGEGWPGIKMPDPRRGCRIAWMGIASVTGARVGETSEGLARSL